jgi:microcystin-dependent protein
MTNRVIEVIRRAGGAASAAASAAAAAASAALADAAASSTTVAASKLGLWRSQWLTTTAYALGDRVKQNDDVYICLIAHTSGTFATDLGASRWEIFVPKGAAGVGAGNMVSTNNLSDLANPSAAVTNLGLTAGVTRINDAANRAGQVIMTMGNAALPGTIKLNGASGLSRTTYAALYSFGVASGLMAATEGGKLAYQFGPGDGSTTFSIPDVRGYVPRAWDDGRGIDSGRAIGSYQADQFQDHSHSGATYGAGAHAHTMPSIVDNLGVNTGNGTAGISGGDLRIASPATTAVGDHAHAVDVYGATSGLRGTETRVKSFAPLFCISY